MRWNTDKIIELLEDERWRITTISPGGDFDTTGLVLIVKSGGRLYIHGFITGDEPIRDYNDIDVEMVEISDGLYSDGGLNSNIPEVIEMYYEVCKRLKVKGFNVVNSMKGYF